MVQSLSSFWCYDIWVWCLDRIGSAKLSLYLVLSDSDGQSVDVRVIDCRKRGVEAREPSGKVLMEVAGKALGAIKVMLELEELLC